MNVQQIFPKTEIENLYVWFSNEDVLIVDQQGNCLASSNTDRVGLNVLASNDFSNSGKIIPLKSKFGKASLVLNRETQASTTKEISFYRSLAELTLLQYFKAKEASHDSIDQFVAKLVSKRVNLNLVSQYESEGRSLGINFDQSRIAILVRFKNFEQRLFLQKRQGDEALGLIQKLKKDITSCINGFFTKNNDLLVAYIGEGSFVIFKAVDKVDEEKFQHYLKNASETIFGPLKTKENGPLTIGFGNVHDNLSGVVEAYKEARLALDLGCKLETGSNPIFYFADFDELRILAEEDNQKKLTYANEIIGRLQNQELRKTLETFFSEDLNITNTALKLKIHPNTVLYRLKKIKEILGLNPKIFDEAAAIRIAMLAQKFLS